MSILNKPLFGTKPRSEKQASAAKASKKPRASKTTPPAGSTASESGAETPLQTVPTTPAPRIGRGSSAPVFVTSPRADLLPPEIMANQRKRSVRRGLRGMVVAALVVSLGASGAAVAWSITETMSFASATLESQSLAVERAGFAELEATKQDIALTEAVQRVGVSTEVDWSAYFAQLQQTLPADVTLTEITVESAGIEDPYVQSDIPLEQERIATLTFTAETGVLPQIPDWIDALSGLPGFADATPSSVQASEGKWTASVTMHIDTDAYQLRFLPAEETTE